MTGEQEALGNFTSNRQMVTPGKPNTQYLKLIFRRNFVLFENLLDSHNPPLISTIKLFIFTTGRSDHEHTDNSFKIPSK